ncbi:MAG: hypothetical protein JXB88_01395 [Spirochaetales bacterium]|nr:hypothetical protein [Spirochaetales bacterium]
MNFADRMKEIIQRSLTNKKVFSEQASEKAKGFGQKGMLYHEISELEKDIENKFLNIGNEVYAALMIKEKKAINKNSIEIKDILLEIMHLEKIIGEKELLLKQAD